jgi:hypothetical protein
MAPETKNPQRPPFWPLSRGKTLELFLGFFPGWLALIGVAIALLMPLIRSCRDAMLD